MMNSNVFRTGMSVDNSARSDKELITLFFAGDNDDDDEDEAPETPTDEPPPIPIQEPPADERPGVPLTVTCPSSYPR